MILGYPFTEKKLWAKNELVLLSFPIKSNLKMRNFRSKTSRYARKAQLLSKMETPSLNQVQSAAGPSNGSRKCVHGCDPFWQVLTLSPEIETNSEKTGTK